VHVAQFAADWWHQPVPSSPQSPQSAPNLQQPPLRPPPPLSARLRSPVTEMDSASMLKLRIVAIMMNE
jgi:hypothetical protein